MRRIGSIRPLLVIAFAATAAIVASALPAAAQTSASYRLNEHVANAGGHPAQGVVAASAGYRLSLDSIGDGVSGASLASASFHLDGGFAGEYRPPGEVFGVMFATKSLLQWIPEKSVGTYVVYRDIVSALPGTFGSCLTTGVTGESYTDTSVPVAGTSYFYLITARNLLGEEGTKGKQSSGAGRPNTAPCP